jgi:hypothetical protein
LAGSTESLKVSFTNICNSDVTSSSSTIPSLTSSFILFVNDASITWLRPACYKRMYLNIKKNAQADT